MSAMRSSIIGYVVESLKAKGARFVENLSEVPRGARTIFSAHGVARAVEEEAAELGLPVIDATCPLVAKVHQPRRALCRAGPFRRPDRSRRPS